MWPSAPVFPLASFLFRYLQPLDDDHFVPIFNAALESYKRKMKKDLALHPLLPNRAFCGHLDGLLCSCHLDKDVGGWRECRLLWMECVVDSFAFSPAV